jgi:tetratricopeptide (TPR) repeat protein
LRADKNGRTVISTNYQVSETAEDKRLEFANLLNQYQKEHQRFFGKEDLLVIIDGLDEIPPTLDISIFDFIPREDMLNDHVFLLLTCRTDGEISDFSKNRLKNFHFTEHRIVQRETEENIETLKTYITKHVFGNRGEPISENQMNLMDWMLNHAENRFLYIRLLKELFAIKSSNDFLTIPKGELLFDYYFETLESLYGSKFFKNVISLLSILSSSYEPLTYREISTLMGEEKPTFLLLAFLSDIRGFISVERSVRGNLLTISHEDWRYRTKEKYITHIREMVMNWGNLIQLEQISMADLDWNKAEHDGLLYLATYLFDYQENYGIFEGELSQTANDFLILLNNKTLDQSQSIYQLKRKLHMQTKYIQLVRQLAENGMIINEKELARIIARKGGTLTHLGLLEEALSEFNEAILLARKLLNQDKEIDQYDLIDFLIRRGECKNELALKRDVFKDFDEAFERIENISKTLDDGKWAYPALLSRLLMTSSSIYFDQGIRESAYSDFTDSILILKRYLEDGAKDDENLLPYLLLSRGKAYLESRFHEMALRDINEAFEISTLRRKEVRNKEDSNLLLNLFMHRGASFDGLGKLEEAYTDYEKALEIWYKQVETGKRFNENDVATLLIYRGKTKAHQGLLEEAQKDFDEAVIIRTKLKDDGKLYNENDMVKALRERGANFNRLGLIQDAIYDYNDAIEIGNNLYHEDKHHVVLDLETAFQERGSIFSTLGLENEAIKDYSEVINIISRYLGNFSNDERDLAYAFMDRAKLYDKQGLWKEALKDYNEGIRLFKKNLDEDNLNLLNILFMYLTYRGSLFKKMELESDMIKDYNEAISILRNLVQKGDPEAEYELARTLMAKEIKRSGKENEKESMKAIDEAIKIYTKLANEGLLKDEERLAHALNHRSWIFYNKGNYRKALRDINGDIEILRKLINQGKQINQDFLPVSLYKRAEIHEWRGELKKALQDFREATDIWSETKNMYELEDEILFKHAKEMCINLESRIGKGLFSPFWRKWK